MTKYKVIDNNENEYTNISEEYLARTAEMKDTYSLSDFSLQEIYNIWSSHSDMLCASWLNPLNKEEIESVFGVTLEEVGEEK